MKGVGVAEANILMGLKPMGGRIERHRKIQLFFGFGLRSLTVTGFCDLSLEPVFVDWMATNSSSFFFFF